MHKEKAKIVEAKIVNGKAVIPKGWGSFVGTGKKGHKVGVVYAIKLQVGGTKGAKRKSSCGSKTKTKTKTSTKKSKSKKAKKSGTRKAAKRTTRKKASAWKNAPGGKMQYRTLASGHVEERAKPTRKGGKRKTAKKSGGKRKAAKSDGKRKAAKKSTRTPKERAADKRRSKAMRGKPFGSNAKTSSGTKKGKRSGTKKGGKRSGAKKGGKRRGNGMLEPSKKGFLDYHKSLPLYGPEAPSGFKATKRKQYRVEG